MSEIKKLLEEVDAALDQAGWKDEPVKQAAVKDRMWPYHALLFGVLAIIVVGLAVFFLPSLGDGSSEQNG
jgi:hypothetical protein